MSPEIAFRDTIRSDRFAVRACVARTDFVDPRGTNAAARAFVRSGLRCEQTKVAAIVADSMPAESRGFSLIARRGADRTRCFCPLCGDFTSCPIGATAVPQRTHARPPMRAVLSPRRDSIMTHVTPSCVSKDVVKAGIRWPQPRLHRGDSFLPMAFLKLDMSNSWALNKRPTCSDGAVSSGSARR
jgi:hypothetical protein